ncbi:6-O-methylguanine DNA methyltransferase [Photobacterium proteolyticum]|jgi:methylated-DNA-[protein]-cysteine S-methyltransferase|uniref:methylated-DNA--[protein]-cysteine S-methyltransferase n=1 Tax=Photobacterium proteolyticum TaxID=1903952 RepID=A0A1Q9GG62_9GAMM|nr:methylated-DNA--[protein]-cysteine S-methyltransferase [Photobacterium proteolyticum]OLQ73430.1 6-O-methylguanine DNA methyltransferase [Photobacterium proteolyticum]
MYYDYLDTVLGKIYLLADNQGLRQLTVGSGGFCPDSSWEHSPEFMQQFTSQLKEYLQGQRKTFTLSLAPQGTSFQQQVWQAITEIPFGTCLSYQQIADKIHQPAAVQAIGMARNVNPIPIIIPCHRVQGDNHQQTNCRYGQDMTLQLLALESGKLTLLQPI